MGFSPFMTEEVFRTPEGRKRAWRALMVTDHGWIRKLYDNTHWISDEMARSYQPSPAKIRAWADKGIKTVVNLRGLRNHIEQPGHYWLEKEACAAAGIELVDLRAFSREAPRRQFLLDIDPLFRSITYPAVMHCKSGSDRAGVGATLYQFLHQGKSLDEAQDQLSLRYGHVKAGKTGVLDHFFDVYREAAAEDAEVPNRDHFMAWVRDRYDPAAVNASFKADALGTFLTDKVLRRE